MNALILNEILYDLDPARTACKENDVFDEYFSISSMIIEEFKISDEIESAIVNVFNSMFWKGILNSDTIQHISSKFKEVSHV